MKNTAMHLQSRNRERGAVAILVTVMWTALFGMAVDGGRLRLPLHEAARAAVGGRCGGARGDAGVHGSRTTPAANDTRLGWPSANGYIDGGRHRTRSAAGNKCTVTITRTYPTFFGGIFGMSLEDDHRHVERQAHGLGARPGDPARGTPGCAGQLAWGFGFNVHGRRAAQVNGNIESNDKVHIDGGRSDLRRCACQINGAAHSACTVFNDAPAASRHHRRNARWPGRGSAGREHAGDARSVLHGGTSTTTAAGGRRTTLEPRGRRLRQHSTGVYCSNGRSSSAPGTGQVDSVRRPPRSSPPRLSESWATASSTSRPIRRFQTLSSRMRTGHRPGLRRRTAIQLANGPGTLYTLNGSIYAPRCRQRRYGNAGLHNEGTLDGMDISVAMGPGQPWTFNGPGGSADRRGASSSSTIDESERGAQHDASDRAGWRRSSWRCR